MNILKTKKMKQSKSINLDIRKKKWSLYCKTININLRKKKLFSFEDYLLNLKKEENYVSKNFKSRLEKKDLNALHFYMKEVGLKPKDDE